MTLDRPKNFDNDPSHYQVKPTQDIQPNRFDVSYGANADRRGDDPQGRSATSDITRQRGRRRQRDARPSR